MLTTLETVLSYKALISVNANVFVLGRAQVDKTFFRTLVGVSRWTWARVGVSEKRIDQMRPCTIA